MSSIQSRLDLILDSLPEGIRLIAVSKYHPASMILEAYEAGQRNFGESHVQELQEKRPQLPDDIKWHFIGHLQTNKVKYIAPYISMIHSADSPHLLAEINKQALKYNRKIPCLLQLHVAQEETKFGFTPQECLDFMAQGEWRHMAGIRLSGVMCMASNVDDEVQIANEFDRARRIFQTIKELYFSHDDSFCECSWGMSDDYPIAIRHGSTLVRVGSLIFGQRV
ncbi:MAG: YggS family pyridoxal phosphate-dependent enzyme [Bacteroidaceae bacterium]|nr:YggS family pyridoxal phosphate-dependent enzyme [Bacteroidaceae bacterium]